MQIPILKTKLHCPKPPYKTVRRPQLKQRLNEGLEFDREITLVSAPAGFGKTTCISEWIYSLELPVAWLSLDPSDDDPGRFLVYLIAALQTIDSDLGQEIEAVIKAGQVPPSDIVSASIINDILEFESRLILVIDDFHSIQDDNIFEVFNNLLANHPSPLHLVFITREDPPLPLARLRANNKLTEIRAKDLRFAGDDIEVFLKDVMGLKLSMKDIAILEEKTEGWIAGLQLAGLTIRDKKNPSKFISKLSGSHRFILGYLTEQVLNQQPQEVREFLFQTAVLDKFNSDLCNAITERSDAKDLLERLYNANLFLVSLDDEYQWFRYHHFFTDLLRDLQKRDEVENLKDIHRRASHWYAEEGMASEAVHHALAAQDYRMALDLLENHASTMLMQGYAKTVDNWIQSIPNELRSTSLKTNLAFAWAHLLQGAYSDLSQYIDRWEPPINWMENPGLRAEWLVIKSLILYMRGEVEACMEMATEALEIVPDQDNRVLGLAYYVQAHYYLLRGNYAKAINIFQKSIQHSREAKSLVPEMMSTISLVGAAFERGKLNQAYEIATQAVSRLEDSDETPPIGAFIYLALGDIYYQWHQIEKGQQATSRALQLSRLGGLNTGLIYCRILFSRLFQIEQKLNSAVKEIQGAVDLLPLEVPEYIRQDVAAQQVRVYLDLNQLDSAELVLRGHGLNFDDQTSFINIFPDQSNPFSIGMLYNCLLRSLLRQDLNSTGLKSGLELAKRIIAEADQRNQFLVSLEALLLQAQFHEKLRDLQASTANIVGALKRGQPEGFIGIFIEQGSPIAEVLKKLIENPKMETVNKDYVKAILAAFNQSQTGKSKFEPLIDPLTDRELDVLLLMAEGLKYKEIASKLFVSLNTVRYHVKAIYGKLDVNNRTQAIEKARKLQIL